MKSEFSRVPEPLLVLLGPLELVMELELTPNRKLARVDRDLLCAELDTKGYYLQMPPGQHMEN